MGFMEYLGVLRRRWLLVGAVVMVTALLAWGYSSRLTPEYAASADVLVGPTDGEASTLSGSEARAEIATQSHVATSLPVARIVKENRSLAQVPDLSKRVSVQPVGAGRILRITSRDTDPEEAARIANAVASAYLQFREQDASARYQKAMDQLNSEATRGETRLRQIDARLASKTLATETRAQLQAERRSLLTDLTQIAAQQDSLGDTLAGVTAGGKLLRQANPPQRSTSPRIFLNVGLGCLVGLLLGAGAALLRDRFDDAVHDESEVRKALGEIPLLGRVPRWGHHSRRGLITLTAPHTAASEEYQRLGVNVRFMLAPTRGNAKTGATVLVTSGQQAEGKTLTACNLAVAATRLGLNVVLVDADLRRGSVAELFGLEAGRGLSDLLAAPGPADSCLVDAGVGSLRILPAGTVPPNPAALLGSSRMKPILKQLSRAADLVIVDSPPVLVGADTLELAHHASMVMVVTRDRITRRRQLAAVTESLRHLAVSSVGVVYNGAGENGRAYARSKRFVRGLGGRLARAQPPEHDRPLLVDESARPVVPAPWTRAAEETDIERVRIGSAR